MSQFGKLTWRQCAIFFEKKLKKVVD